MSPQNKETVRRAQRIIASTLDEQAIYYAEQAIEAAMDDESEDALNALYQAERMAA